MTFFDAFIPQLLATIVGGAIGVFAVWLAFRWQRNAAARDGVDRAVENLLQRIADHIAAVDAYNAEFNMTVWTAGSKLQRTYPHAASVSIACELLRMRTMGKERKVADDIGEAWNYVAHASSDTIGTAGGVLASAISKWRLGASRAEVSESLETARQLSLDAGEVEVRADDDR